MIAAQIPAPCSPARIRRLEFFTLQYVGVTTSQSACRANESRFDYGVSDPAPWSIPGGNPGVSTERALCGRTENTFSRPSRA